MRAGCIDHNPAENLRDRHSPLRTFTRTYGKVQARNPGRWLTHHQAFGTLVPSCNDGTIVGVRDEIVLRLGLAGMRISEIASLRLRNLHRLPTITWTGKGSKPRTMTASSGLIDAISRYVAAYPDVRDDDPLICRLVFGASRQGGPPRIAWHTATSNRALYDLITKRSRACGLGHVAPHDLRRSAAGILHRATNADGAHHFDLLDIQKVLGHSDPATTMRSYLAPMDTDVYDRAASVLD